MGPRQHCPNPADLDGQNGVDWTRAVLLLSLPMWMTVSIAHGPRCSNLTIWAAGGPRREVEGDAPRAVSMRACVVGRGG